MRRGAASGNPNADPANGQFAPKGQTTAQKVVAQTGNRQSAGTTDVVAQRRRRDLVRRAAMQMEMMGLGDATEWLKSFVDNPGAVRVDLFLADVKEHRMDFLVDNLVPGLKATVAAAKNGTVVKVKAPQGWLRQVMASLDDQEVVQLHQRLVGQGFDPDDVKKQLLGKVARKRRSTLEQFFGETAPK